MSKICPRYAQDMPKIWPPVRRSWQNVFLTKRLSRSAWKKCRKNRSWQNVFLTKRLSWSWQNVFLTKRLRRSWQNVFLTKRLLTYYCTVFIHLAGHKGLRPKANMGVLDTQQIHALVFCYMSWLPFLVAFHSFPWSLVLFFVLGLVYLQWISEEVISQ